MAIITDPDLLDRSQVIFGPTSTVGNTAAVGTRTISLSQVGASQISGVKTDGVTANGAVTLASVTNLQTAGVAAGDVLCLFSGPDQGHYLIASVSGNTVTINATSTDYPFDGWYRGNTGLIFDIRDPHTGSIADGVSEQAIYSFAKEEWRADTGSSAISASYTDDLIRHPFPYEGITPTQFEIGGGTSHDNWDYHNLHTKNLVRNGGWRKVDSSSVNQEEYTSFISLGAMDADAQPYYQLTSTTTAPTNFAFQGPVNESVQLYDNGVYDRRSYFKAFLRKKGKTYASYNLLTEQNLTSLTYKDYAFPLTHAVDAAITATDGDIVGVYPYSGQNATNRTTVLRSNVGTAGSVSSVSVVNTAGVYTFEKTGETFLADGVRAGDAIKVTAGNNNGLYFHILSVTETTLTVSTADTIATGSGTETIEIYTKYIVEGRTDGVLANVDGLTGTLTSATGGFNTGSTQVRVGDMVIITESGSGLQGVYKVVSQDSATQLTLNTDDLTTKFSGETSINFEVTRPSMYAQYKYDTIVATSNPATYTLDFTNNTSPTKDTITASTGTPFASVLPGDIVYIQNAATAVNDGYYTVFSATNTVLTLVATDSLTSDTSDTTATVTIYRGFTRTIAGVDYGFKWRVFGNSASLGDVYQFLQHQARQTTDIDWGYNGGTAFRGDITDQLLTYAAPTGVTVNMYVDDLDADDTNNITYTDATSTTRAENFVATFTIDFNSNLLGDNDVVWKMFFTNDDAGDNLGRDYGTANAIIVQTASLASVEGSNPSISYSGTYDYDNNTQRGTASANTPAPVTIVAIGLNTAQFVRLDSTINRTKGQTFSLVSALERNYNNS